MRHWILWRRGLIGPTAVIYHDEKKPGLTEFDRTRKITDLIEVPDGIPFDELMRQYPPPKETENEAPAVVVERPHNA